MTSKEGLPHPRRALLFLRLSVKLKGPANDSSGTARKQEAPGEPQEMGSCGFFL